MGEIESNFTMSIVQGLKPDLILQHFRHDESRALLQSRNFEGFFRSL